MGYDQVVGPGTYGSGCMPGCTRQFEWWREHYDAGTLGCFNPASMGGLSLHAEGRAMDIALNANDAAQRARGDAIFDRVVANPEQFGAQEMLFRGFIWSWRRKAEGKRFPPPAGEQTADHMNHVHLGIDVNAARNWQPSWVGAVEPEKPPTRRNRHVIFVIINGDKGEAYQYVGGPTNERQSYLRLYGSEPLDNASRGSPVVRLTRAEMQAYTEGKPLNSLGARGWTW